MKLRAATIACLLCCGAGVYLVATSVLSRSYQDRLQTSGEELTAVVVEKWGGRGGNPATLQLGFVSPEGDTLIADVFVSTKYFNVIERLDTVAIRWLPEKSREIALVKGSNEKGIVGLRVFGGLCLIILSLAYLNLSRHVSR